MLSLKEWVNEWLHTYKRIMVKPSTFDSYLEYSTHITCDKPLNELTVTDIQLMINEMVLANKQLSTIKHMLVVVRQSLKKARALGYISGLSCMDGIELPKARPKRVEGLSDEYVNLIIRNSGRSFYGDFFKVLIYTGMRVGELIALRWCDVDWFAGVIRIENTDYHGKLQPCKSDSGVRALPMYGDLRNLLEKRYKYKAAEGERVFLNTLDKPIVYRSVLDRWHDYCINIGMYKVCGFHVLRHTFAHRAIRSGIPIKVVSAWLGHADVNITLNVYDHIDQEDFRRAAGALSDSFFRERQCNINKSEAVK